MAEAFAADYLTREGYIVRERNWSPRGGHVEIDIVAQQKLTIVFVEVKARVSDFQDPADAVTEEKTRKLVRCASAYLATLPEELDVEYRFDIISVSGPPDSMRLEHLPDAFLPPFSI